MKIIDSIAPQYTRYPWDDWLDGQARRAQQGEDFTISPKDFAISVRKAAKSRGITVHVAVNTERGTVDFQAVVPAPAAPTAPAPAPAAPAILEIPVQIETAQLPTEAELIARGQYPHGHFVSHPVDREVLRGDH